MTARKLDKLDEIVGRERKMIARFVGEPPTEEDLMMLRHYENQRQKMYEKLRKVVGEYLGRRN